MRAYSAERQLKELAYNIPFPMPCGEMIVVARYMSCSPTTVRLLQRFDQNDVFENGVDFINRCDGVRLLMNEVRHTPKELLYSSQD